MIFKDISFEGRLKELSSYIPNFFLKNSIHNNLNKSIK